MDILCVVYKMLFCSHTRRVRGYIMTFPRLGSALLVPKEPFYCLIVTLREVVRMCIYLQPLTLEGFVILEGSYCSLVTYEKDQEEYHCYVYPLYLKREIFPRKPRHVPQATVCLVMSPPCVVSGLCLFRNHSNVTDYNYLHKD